VDFPAHESLAAWESYYVIVGSSAAALTGLQFVVIVLAAEMDALAGSTTRAFGTPTIVHFCATLLISAILSAPWHGLSNAGVCLGLCGVVGFAYVVRVIGHTRRQTDYKPVFEDWLWHAALPLAGYAALLVAAVVLPRRPEPSLFVVGGTALLLLFIGIHNAWDAVTYIAIDRRKAPETKVNPKTRTNKIKQ
jgi:hypothetical protein